MKKMVNLKTIVLTGTLTVSLIILGTTNSQAALQANPTTHQSPVKKSGSTWITQIRQMEGTGQTMGLDETLDGLNATEENGIDVHMMLPTEYGAIAILSASGYGNNGKLMDENDPFSRSTTGNATGTFHTGERWEGIAGRGTMSANKYLTDTTAASQALLGASRWHDGTDGSWTAVYYTVGMQNNGSMLVVGGNGGLFSSYSYYGRTAYMSGGQGGKNAWTNTVTGTAPSNGNPDCSSYGRGVATILF